MVHYSHLPCAKALEQVVVIIFIKLISWGRNYSLILGRNLSVKIYNFTFSLKLQNLPCQQLLRNFLIKQFEKEMIVRENYFLSSSVDNVVVASEIQRHWSVGC